MEQEPPFTEQSMGEDPGIDMRRSFARHANNALRSSPQNGDTVIPLEGLGEIDVSKIRFRDALEEGMLRAYIRQEAHDPKVQIIGSTVIGLGIVALGVKKIRHQKKK